MKNIYVDEINGAEMPKKGTKWGVDLKLQFTKWQDNFYQSRGRVFVVMYFV